MTVIFKLTKQQRAALLLTTTKEGCPQGVGAHRRMMLHLDDNRLIIWGVRSCFITMSGEMALRAQPRNSVWWPTLPDLENSHAVRKLMVCKGCGSLNLNLPITEFGPMHAACVVMHHGWQALVNLPHAELNKMTVQDFGHLGLTIVDLQEVLGWKAS